MSLFYIWFAKNAKICYGLLILENNLFIYKLFSNQKPVSNFLNITMSIEQPNNFEQQNQRDRVGKKLKDFLTGLDVFKVEPKTVGSQQVITMENQEDTKLENTLYNNEYNQQEFNDLREQTEDKDKELKKENANE